MQLIDDIDVSGAQALLFVIPTKDNKSNIPVDKDGIERFIDGRKFLGSEDYYTRDAHWRPSGHDKAARRIFGAVEEIRLAQ